MLGFVKVTDPGAIVARAAKDKDARAMAPWLAKRYALAGDALLALARAMLDDADAAAFELCPSDFLVLIDTGENSAGGDTVDDLLELLRLVRPFLLGVVDVHPKMQLLKHYLLFQIILRSLICCFLYQQ